MAVKTTLVDDVTGEEEAQTRTFSIDDEVYEIDLVDETYQDLRKALAGFIESARKVTKGKKPAARVSVKPPAPGGSAPSAADRSTQLDAIRTWARSTGRKVSDRGRVPKDIIQAFEESHGAPSPVFSATSA